MLQNRWGDCKEPWEVDEVAAAVRNTKKYPEQKVWGFSLKYVLITLLAKIFHIKTSEDKLKKLHADIKLLCCRKAGKDTALCRAYLDGVEKMWPRLKELALDPGFYRFVYDHAMESVFMLPYFAVLSPHAPALEAARGYSVDLAGRYRKIDPQEDPQAFEFVYGERTFRSFGFRAVVHQVFFLNESKDMQESGLGKPNILIVGGGLLVYFRYFHLRPEMLKDIFGQITVYDNDPNMPEYLKMVFDKPMSEYGIDYNFTDAEKAFSNALMWGKFDIVDCTGVLSYCQDDESLCRMLKGMARLLRPGGHMLFDLQTLTPDMLRCAFTLAWKTNPPLKPNFTPKGTIRRVERVAKECGLKVSDHWVDESNSIPALVDFVLQKPYANPTP